MNAIVNKPAVFTGPRVERRRILLDGIAHSCTLQANDVLKLEDGREVKVADAVHLPPCEPTKIVCVHLSYTSRGIESRNMPQPTPEPTYFMKPLSTLNHHGGTIVKPAGCQYLNYEGEYGVVISKRCKDVTPDEAWDYVAGFTPVLDMGMHDFRDTDAGSMFRVKGMDGFCPIGPGVVSGVDIREQTLRTYRNGHIVQEAKIGDEQVWGANYMIADVARYITLEPGDIILTGTPCHSRSLSVGDLIELEITNIGRLSNRVVAGPEPRANAMKTGHQAVDSEEARRVAKGNDSRVPERFKENYRKS
jgi:5-oxopent-3-ene-1,2,5-tricarboxylate decarboxylase / 2-hydroxyhepta-2,4-diene-1,7-dioate isomerase